MTQQLIYLTNMAGNFKKLDLLFFLFLLLSCEKPMQNQKEIVKEIINQNMKVYISNLYGLPIADQKNGKFQIFLIKKAGNKNFFKEQCESIIEMGVPNSIVNCKNDYFNLLKKEGFSINDKTKYLSFEIDKLADENIKLIANDSDIKEDAYVEIRFSNMYIDNNIKKSFIVLEETDFSEGRYGGKVDIYFYEELEGTWVFYKKLMLITA